MRPRKGERAAAARFVFVTRGPPVALRPVEPLRTNERGEHKAFFFFFFFFPVVVLFLFLGRPRRRLALAVSNELMSGPGQLTWRRIKEMATRPAAPANGEEKEVSSGAQHNNKQAPFLFFSRAQSLVSPLVWSDF